MFVSGACNPSLLSSREVAAAREDPRCSLIQAGTQKPHSGERRKEKTGVIRKGKKPSRRVSSCDSDRRTGLRRHGYHGNGM
ncbi:hypothetical protein OJAV_G00222490 [Oryzias javanicus]|uniref:Uncharacterized protein n=1 Tax=Oryzias javanicus TaxID=123683 RepID=A0A437C2F4_ORYJA|nr:hypothetical protein OJAV_G00222490 [Oryzias javanicus]